MILMHVDGDRDIGWGRFAVIGILSHLVHEIIADVTTAVFIRIITVSSLVC